MACNPKPFRTYWSKPDGKVEPEGFPQWERRREIASLRRYNLKCKRRRSTLRISQGEVARG
jgi:hypothetical protein